MVRPGCRSMDCSPVVLSSLNTGGKYTSYASGGCAAPSADHELAGAATRRWLHERHGRAVPAPPREPCVAERAVAVGGTAARESSSWYVWAGRPARGASTPDTSAIATAPAATARAIGRFMLCRPA